MQTDDLARWVNEIYGELMDLKNKMNSGGGTAFNPEMYDYITPFMEVVSDPFTVQAADDGITSYVATADCYTVSSVFCDSGDAYIVVYSPGAGDTWIDSVIMYEQPAGSGIHKFVFPLKAGQKIRIVNPDAAESGTVITVYPLIKAHLQEHVVPVVTRKRSTRKK